jgi:HD superfamily phosphohydrolase
MTVLTEKDSNQNSTVQEFKDLIETFVAGLFKGYTDPNLANKSGKVINDPVWGNIYLKQYEVLVLDSPLLQRLRNISQLGRVDLIYPGARHSRFEHSIGVFHLACKIVDNINRRCEESDRIGDRDFAMIRLAALLHDIGHCYYSHLSEKVYGNMKQFNDLRKLAPFQNGKPHEIFAYFMINTNTFKCYFRSLEPKIEDVDDEFFENIGKMIMGEFISEDVNGRKIFKEYMTNIINGDFDADKLDYLERDSYFCGLFLSYDIERFLYKINLYKNEGISNEEHRSLIISLAGVSAIEEIAFCKIMLNSYIYFHQKALAVDTVIDDFSYYLIREEKTGHPADFLNLTDKTILCRPFLSENLSDHSTMKAGDVFSLIEKRQLPKRALVLKYMYIEKKEKGKSPREKLQERFTEKTKSLAEKDSEFKVMSDQIGEILNSSDLEKEDNDLAKIFGTTKGNMEEYIKTMDAIRKGVFSMAQDVQDWLQKDNSHVDFTEYDIYVCFRDQPSFSSENVNIIDYDNEPRSLNDIMPLGPWTKAFAANKWAGYIFAREDLIPLVNLAARYYFKINHGLEIKEGFCYAYLKKKDREKAQGFKKQLKEFEKEIGVENM